MDLNKNYVLETQLGPIKFIFRNRSLRIHCLRHRKNRTNSVCRWAVLVRLFLSLFVQFDVLNFSLLASRKILRVRGFLYRMPEVQKGVWHMSPSVVSRTVRSRRKSTIREIDLVSCQAKTLDFWSPSKRPMVVLLPFSTLRESSSASKRGP